MDLLKIPNKFLIEVFEHFDIKNLVRIETVSKFFLNLIRNYPFRQILCIKPKYLKNVVANHNFLSYKLPFKSEDNQIIYLVQTLASRNLNLHSLNLSYCRKITDESLKHLGNIHSLNLSFCVGITDEGLKYLSRSQIHSLNLSFCNITDCGLMYLSRSQIRVLNLFFTKITSEMKNLLKKTIAEVHF